MAKATLQIGNVIYDQFKSLHVHKSMREICGAIKLSMADFTDGSLKDFKFYSYSPIKFKINDTVLIDGYMDDFDIIRDKNFQSIEIEGRDNTMDLVDNTHSGNTEYKNLSVENIIKRLCAPFGITVSVHSTATSQSDTVLETYTANEGAYLVTLIGELCRDFGILAVNYGDKYLTLTGPRSTISEYSIEYGNVGTRGHYKYSNKNRHSSYVVKGYGIGTDNNETSDYISASGTFTDSIIKRTRPLTIFAENITDKDKCKKRAIWEARLRAGQSRKVYYTIPQWDHKEIPFQINTLMNVIDKYSDINDKLLVDEIDYLLDEEGENCIIGLVDRNTYSQSSNAITIKGVLDG